MTKDELINTLETAHHYTKRAAGYIKTASDADPGRQPIERTRAALAAALDGINDALAAIAEAPTTRQEARQEAQTAPPIIERGHVITKYTGRPIDYPPDRLALNWIMQTYTHTLPARGTFTGAALAETIRQIYDTTGADRASEANRRAAILAETLDAYQNTGKAGTLAAILDRPAARTKGKDQKK